jgi:two-component system, NarL family, response regulator
MLKPEREPGPAASAPIRVLCVDDHRIVRDGLSLLIDGQPDMKMVGCAGTGDEALALFTRLQPDVTLMDLQLGTTSGVEAIIAIRAADPDARIVVLTMSRGDEDIFRALQAGAAMYLLKDTTFDQLIHVIRDVHAGRQPELGPDLRARLAERAGRPALTPREREVLELVRTGLRNREIAASLGVSEETVQTHVKSILAKLDVPDRTAAIDVALRRGIIHPSSI